MLRPSEDREADGDRLVCDCCGRTERGPFDEGDSCYALCGGKFVRVHDEMPG